MKSHSAGWWSKLVAEEPVDGPLARPLLDHDNDESERPTSRGTHGASLLRVGDLLIVTKAQGRSEFDLEVGV